MFQFLKYSYLLIPVGFILGPFFVNLLSIVGVTSFLFLTFKYKLYDYWKNKASIFFLSFALIFILSSIVSNNPLFSLESSISFLRYIIFLISIKYLIENDEHSLSNFSFILIISLTLLALSLFIDFFYYFFITENTISINRYSGLFFDEKIAGFYLIHLFPLSLGLIYREYKFEKNILNIILLLSYIGVISAAIILSGERTATFYLVLLLFLYFFFLNKVKLKNLLLFSLIIFTFFYILSNNDNLRDRYWHTTVDSLKNEYGEIQIISTKHNSMYETSLRMFSENLILGIGPNMYRKECQFPEYTDKNYENPSTHPHNIYLQLLAETGILGFIFLMSSFSCLMYLLFKNFININFKNKKFLSNYKLFVLFNLIISFWPLSPSLNFFGSYNFILLIFAVGFFLANKSRVE